MRKLLTAMALTVAAPASAHATDLILNDPWSYFWWGPFEDPNAVVLLDPLDGFFRLLTAGPATIQVVDLGCSGDVFQIAISTGGGGSTSAPVDTGCGLFEWDPDLALLDPSYSRGSFNVGAGDHQIDIGITAYDFYGVGAIRALSLNTVVPEPATMVLLATGLVGLAGAGAVQRRKRKV